MATLADFERDTGIRVVTRDDWGAREPKWEPPAWQAPCDNAWVHHAAVEGSDDAAEMRQHQRFHMDTKGWSDIFYNLALPDPNPGVVFEGRGLFRASEDVDWAEILVMGNFEVDKPSKGTLDVLTTLLRYGIDHGWWRNNIGGHRDKPDDQGQTSCPGRHLYARLPDVRHAVNTTTPEEDDVIYELVAEGRSPRTVIDGTIIGWDEGARRKRILEEFTRDGVKVHRIKVSRDDYNYLSDRIISANDLAKVLAAARTGDPHERGMALADLFKQFGVEVDETIMDAIKRQFGAAE